MLRKEDAVWNGEVGGIVARAKMKLLRQDSQFAVYTLENNIDLDCPSESGGFTCPVAKEQRNEELTNGPETVKAVYSGPPGICLFQLVACSYKAWSYRC